MENKTVCQIRSSLKKRELFRDTLGRSEDVETSRQTTVKELKRKCIFY